MKNNSITPDEATKLHRAFSESDWEFLPDNGNHRAHNGLGDWVGIIRRPIHDGTVEWLVVAYHHPVLRDTFVTHSPRSAVDLASRVLSNVTWCKGQGTPNEASMYAMQDQQIADYALFGNLV
jgi:hypothetical protein